jgi:hypothetical protein
LGPILFRDNLPGNSDHFLLSGKPVVLLQNFIVGQISAESSAAFAFQNYANSMTEDCAVFFPNYFISCCFQKCF